jgi:hypothetical protein
VTDFVTQNVIRVVAPFASAAVRQRYHGANCAGVNWRKSANQACKLLPDRTAFSGLARAGAAPIMKTRRRRATAQLCQKTQQ